MSRTAGFAVTGVSSRISAAFTRPANTTAYTAGDVVSNDATTTTLLEIPAIGRRPGATGYITGVILITDLKSITPSIKLKFFNASTATVAADNAASKELYADASKVAAGAITMPAMTTPADTTNSTLSKSEDMTLRVPFKCAADSQSLFVLLEAVDAFTPASGQGFTLVLFVDHD